MQLSREKIPSSYVTEDIILLSQNYQLSQNFSLKLGHFYFLHEGKADFNNPNVECVELELRSSMTIWKVKYILSS